MNSFADYSRSFSLGADPSLLDVVPEEDGFFVLSPEGPLLTPGGRILSHVSEDFVRRLVTDLQLGSNGFLGRSSSMVLYSYRLDVLDTGIDPFRERFDELLEEDSISRIKTTGAPFREPYPEDHPQFTFSFLTLSGLMNRINRFAGKVMGELAIEETETQPFARILRFSYERLTVDEKVTVQALSSLHRSGVVLPLMLTLGEIGVQDYAKALIALGGRSPEFLAELLVEAALILDCLEAVSQSGARQKSVNALIGSGEGDSLEFKSTLRWDIRAGKTNPAIEHASLKTLAAFLNTNGGTLLIGVRDDGSVEGIETDRLANEDKFLLHLWTLIRNCLGCDVSPYIHTTTMKSGGKTICRVDCHPSKRPVFLRQPGFGEELFIRVGPSSNALDISEALKYVEVHFGK